LRRSTGNTDTGALQIQQSFESVNSTPFFGKTVTFSFYARKSATFTGTLVGQLISGTGTDQSLVVAFSGLTVVGSSSPSLTTTWTRYVATGTVSASATQLGILFTADFVGTAGTDDYFEVTGAQVDLGTYTAASAPTYRRTGGTIQGELDACSRYFQKSYNQSAAPGSATFDGSVYSGGNAVGTTAGYLGAQVLWSVRMRTAPTITTYDGAYTSGKVSRIAPALSDQNNLTPSAAFNSETGCLIQSASGNALSGLFFQWTASAEL
jgi:hypothetical protein